MHSKRANNNRPPEDKRTFKSEAIEEYITQTTTIIKNQDIVSLFTNCYPNTLDITVNYDKSNKDTFIITGDIKAMWLRDSSFQVYPYLKHCKSDQNLNDMILGLFNRQLKCILISPYANAFNKEPLKSEWWNEQTYKLINGKKVLAMNDNLWERKFELDSLMSPFFIMCKYYEATKDHSFMTQDFYVGPLMKL